MQIVRSHVPHIPDHCFESQYSKIYSRKFIIAEWNHEYSLRTACYAALKSVSNKFLSHFANKNKSTDKYIYIYILYMYFKWLFCVSRNALEIVNKLIVH